MIDTQTNSPTMNPSRTRIPGNVITNQYRRLTYDNVRAMVRYCFFRIQYRDLDTGLFYIGSNSELMIGPSARVHFGHSVEFMRDCTLHFQGKVNIGNKVYFNRGCHIISLEALTIGDYSIFGEKVSIHDENHDIEDNAPLPDSRMITAPVIIGTNVWVGAKATILQGVTIGDNAVIGANAVVTRDVPPNSIALGIPARVIRTIDRSAGRVRP